MYRIIKFQFEIQAFDAFDRFANIIGSGAESAFAAIEESNKNKENNHADVFTTPHDEMKEVRTTA